MNSTRVVFLLLASFSDEIPETKEGVNVLLEDLPWV